MEVRSELTILEDLVSINTVNPPGNERMAAEYCKSLLAPLGYRCKILDMGGGRANFIAEIGRGDGPLLIFNGHLDVVPAVGAWTDNPFTLTVKEGRAYARGACDMKGGLAAMCQAAITVAERGGPKIGTLALVFVADEEDANRGIKAYLNYEKGSQIKGGAYAVIGEPTELSVAVAHRGVARSFLDVRGTARHAALGEMGDSALEKIPAVLAAVGTANSQLKDRTHRLLPPPGIALTMVEAYEKDNVIPGKVRFLTDFRTLPGMEYEETEKIVREHLHKNGVMDVEITKHFFLPGGEIKAEEPFVALCCEAVSSVRGKKAAPGAFEASCEQCFLTKSGIMAVILGPGSLDQAHTVDEYVELQQLHQGAAIYEEIAKRMLKYCNP